MMMIYIMNSAVMPAGNFGTYRYSPATIDDLRRVVSGSLGPWQSAIGYPQNLQIIESWTGVNVPLNRSETTFADGDMAIVMRMKRRIINPATKGAPVSDDPEDWEFAWVSFHGE